MVGELNEASQSALRDAFLLVSHGKSSGQRFRMDSPGKVLGSSATADIQLDDPKMSELHAMIVLRDGAHFVFDLGSETGTFLNDQRIEEAGLSHGDRIRLGNTVITYNAFDESAAQSIVIESPVAGNGTLFVDGPPPGMIGGQRALPPPRSMVPSGPDGLLPHLDPRFMPHQELMHAQAARALGNVRPVGGEEEQEKEMSLEDIIAKIRGVVEFFRPYSRWILAFALMGGLLGLGMFFMSPPSRRAIFAMSLVANLAENPVAGTPSQRPSVEFFRSAELNFKSPALIEKTLAALGEVDAGPDRVAGIQNRLQFGATSLISSTYMGAYETGSGDEALRFLNAHVKLYLDAEIDKTLKVIKGQVEFLERQVAETEKELRRTEWELLEFKKKNIDGLPEQARQNYDLLFDLQRQMAANDKEIDRVAALRRVDVSRLKDEQALVPSRVLATRPYQARIVDLNARIAEGKASGMGVDHPQMIRWRTEVDELTRLARDSLDRGEETEVERQINPIYNNIKDSLRQLEAAGSTAYQERERLKKEIERVRAVVDRLPELETTYAELTRSYEARRQIHSRIFNQLESSKLQVELERASAAARYDIIAPPTLELSSPTKALITRTLAGVIAGVMAGLGFAAYKRLKTRIVAAAAASRERGLARIN